MNVQNFHGFENLKEVQCSGITLPYEVKFLSLTLYRKYDRKKDAIIGSLEIPENICKTHGDYSSCIIIEGDRRSSKIKTLVSDLNGGERTTIGCNITAFFITGHDQVFIGSWELEIARKSKIIFI